MYVTNTSQLATLWNLQTYLETIRHTNAASVSFQVATIKNATAKYINLEVHWNIWRCHLAEVKKIQFIFYRPSFVTKLWKIFTVTEVSLPLPKALCVLGMWLEIGASIPHRRPRRSATRLWCIGERDGTKDAFVRKQRDAIFICQRTLRCSREDATSSCRRRIGVKKSELKPTESEQFRSPRASCPRFHHGERRRGVVGAQTRGIRDAAARLPFQSRVCD